MGFYGDVKPGDTFKPSAALENDVRHFLNRLNGFSGGPITAGNPGIIRIPVYNATSAALQVGKAVSIDISGIIANGCYPAIAYSDTMPCFGVLVKDLNPAEVGDCILSGLAVVQIASTPATGNYALPGTGGVFVRGNEGVPILNVSETVAVVMLGNVKTAGGGVTYEAGLGIDSDLLSGGTISGNYIGVGNVSVTPVIGSTNGQMKIECSGGGGGNMPPGVIIAYSGPLDADVIGERLTLLPDGAPSGTLDAPAGWLHCHGQAISRTTYAALFAAIGTVYGEGDGRTTFNVPDLRGAFLRGAELPGAYTVLAHYFKDEDELEPGGPIVDVNGAEIETGYCYYGGSTVSLVGGIIGPNGITIEAGGGSTSSVLLAYEDITWPEDPEDPDTYIVILGGMKVEYLEWVSGDGEQQSSMGVQHHEQLPSVTGNFWNLAVNGTTVAVHGWTDPSSGAFRGIERPAGSFVTQILPFPIENNDSQIMISGNGGIDGYSPTRYTFDDVKIYGSTSTFNSGIEVTGTTFSAYYGQQIPGGSNNFTVADYMIQHDGDEPPETVITIPKLGGHVLPTRYLVHWLIKY